MIYRRVFCFMAKMMELGLNHGHILLKTQPHAQNRELIMELNNQTTRKPVLNGMPYNKLTKILHEMLRHVVMFFCTLKPGSLCKTYVRRIVSTTLN